MRLDELERHLSSSPLVRIEEAAFERKGVELWLKRDDLLHPIISGNKWRKLKYVLADALHGNARRIVSMGGAYSNHLHALAYAGRSLGLATAAFVRGEKPPHSNPTLRDIEAWGMRLTFVSRGEYRQLREHKRHDALPGLQEGDYWLPEGGATALALKGVGEIVDEIGGDFDWLVAPCGTGTTLAGLIAAAPPSSGVLGIAALKGADFLNRDVALLIPDKPADNWRIALDYHCGGFARSHAGLETFMQGFERRHGIELDPVYTGKMLYGLYDLVERGAFSPGQRMIAVHTGGLQGRRA